MGNKCKCNRLSALAFGASLGIVTGVFMMLLAWASWTWTYGTAIIDQWASIYPGVEASLKGGFIALAWGFLEGFILGLVWALIYNLFLCCCRCCRCCSCCNKTSDVECVTK